MRFQRYFTVALALVLSIFLASCDALKACLAKEFRQAELADGVARLSTQSLSMILSEINTNKEYGFGSPRSKFRFKKLSKDEYGKVEVTETIENVAITYPNETLVYTDCNGLTATWKGLVRVILAERSMKGFAMKGDGKKNFDHKKGPVLPDPHEIKIRVLVEVENFHIHFLSRQEKLFFKKGVISFVAEPRLARDFKTNNLPIAATSNTKFESIQIRDAKVILKSPEVNMKIPIESSNFDIHVGEWENGKSNSLSGNITIFGQKHELTYDKKGLDPDFNVEKFRSTYVPCSPNLKGKLDFDYAPTETIFSRASGGYATMLLGQVIKKLEEDNVCGFKSPAALKSATLERPNGQSGSSNEVTLNLPAPCRVKFDHYQTNPDAFGFSYTLNGEVDVTSAESIVKGMQTQSSDDYLDNVQRYENLLKSTRLKDQEAAKKIVESLRMVAPISKDAVQAKAKIKLLGNFTVSDNVCNKTFGATKDKKNHCSHKFMHKRQGLITVTFRPTKNKAKSSTISGHMYPVLGKDTDPASKTCGICMVPTSEVKAKLDFQNVKLWLDSKKVKLNSGEIKTDPSIHMLVNGDLTIVPGQRGHKENYIFGKNFVVSGTKAQFSGKSDLQLSTLNTESFSLKAFRDSFLKLKKGALKLVKSDDRECNAEEAFGVNLARLLVQTAGGLAEFAGSELKSVSALKSSQTEDLAAGRARETMEISYTPGLSDVSKRLEAFSLYIPASGIENNQFFIKTFTEGKLGKVSVNQNSWPVTNFFKKALAAGGAGVSGANTLYVYPDSATATALNIEVKNIEGGMSVKLNDPHMPFLEFVSAESLKVVLTPLRLRGDEADEGFSKLSTDIIRFDEIAVNDARLYFINEGIKIPITIKRAELKAHAGWYDAENNNNVFGKIEFAVDPGFQKTHNDEMTTFKISKKRNVALDPSKVN